MGDAGCVRIGMGGMGGVDGRTVAMLSLGTAMPVGFSYPKASQTLPSALEGLPGDGGPLRTAPLSPSPSYSEEFE